MRTRTYLPRPEYPRPDRQRSFVHGVDWLNLNGPWEFRFETGESGTDLQWHMPSAVQWPDQIIVPFCWESLAAWGEADAAGNDHFFARRVYRQPLEVTLENYRSMPRYEVGWYRRSVVVPENDHWTGKRVILTIGAADFFTDGWSNGQHLGHHEGGYLPIEFDLTDHLHAREDGRLEATIVLRVEDPMQNTEQPVGKQWGWYSSASGIWQTVFLEPRSPTFIERFEITPDLAGPAISLKIFSEANGTVEATITAPTGAISTHSLVVENGSGRTKIPIHPLCLWDPGDPRLYQLQLTLASHEGHDRVFGYFGMRSLVGSTEAIDEPAALVLNGEPIYIRGALYQSYHAEGIYTAGDVQALQDDILAAKRAGFDLLRVHIKIDDPLLLYYADTLGILLMADFPNFGEGGDTPLGRRRFEEMMRGGFARDFNHPSIVAWCLFNETWGFGGQVEFVKLINPIPPSSGIDPVPRLPGTRIANADAYNWVQSMWRLAKELDSSRLIEDMSVVAWDHLQYYGHGETDVNSWHFYTDKYEVARAHIEEVVQKTFKGSTYNTVPGFAQGSQPLINSEYGGVGALDGDIDVSWSFKFLTNELRRLGKLSAYIYTELHDVEWERNGFLNYDRTPKNFGYDPTIVNQGDVLPIDAPPIQRCAAGQEISIPVYSSHFSRQRRESVTLYWRLSGVDSLGWMHDDLGSGSQAIAFSPRRVELALDLRLLLPPQTMLCTLWVRAMTPDGTLVARNYVQILVNGGFPALERSANRVVIRAEPHTWSGAEWTGAYSDRDHAAEVGKCHGNGSGHFEWELPIDAADLALCSRLRVLCEASSCREGMPQTDSFVCPSGLEIWIEDTPVYHCTLPNHPHDSRGALSYLHGQKGAYGYLTHGVLEGAPLEALKERHPERLMIRCVCPPNPTAGGLTIYGAESGRYPIPPTLILEL